ELYTERRDIHFLTGNRKPRPWINFFMLGEDGAQCEHLSDVDGMEFEELDGSGDVTSMDTRIIADALRAATLSKGLDDATGTWRVRCDLPARVYLDWRDGLCRRLGAQDDLTGSDVVYELLPPTVAARWRDLGVSGHLVDLTDTDDAHPTARALAAIESPPNTQPTKA